MRWLPLLVCLTLCLGATAAKPWPEIDKLLQEQKYQEALDAVEPRLQAAIKAKDEREWAKALVTAVQLKTALGGAETSVRFLKEQPWPASGLPKLTLQLFYSHSLTNYRATYGWEIRKRERVDTKGVVDLKAWTTEQINAEAVKTLFEAWKDRATLSKEPLASLKEYLQPNNYPDGIRSTLRDALSYLLVEQLADTSTWTPAESNELHRLDLKAMINGPIDGLHPMQRALGVLDDLEAWHKGAGHDDAALEARLTRIRVLNEAYNDATKRKELVAYLNEYLPGKKGLKWWPMGMYALAKLQRESGELVAALNTARAGGGDACQSLVEELEAPYYSLEGMQTDAAKRRSIEIVHKNFKALHFRAYAVDLLKEVETVHQYGVLPDTDDYLKKLKGQKPAAAWTTELPDTPDLVARSTFVTPPFEKPGLYYVVASDSVDFKPKRLSVVGMPMIISDFVMMNRTESGRMKVTVVKGEKGEPVSGAKVRLYQFQYGKKPKLRDDATTDKTGEVTFTATTNDYATFFLVGEKDGQAFVDPEHQYLQPERPEGVRKSSFLYTDRSVYRPNQKAQWKVVTYQGKAGKSDYVVAPGQAVTISLMDANYQVVEQIKTKTNEFGSAAGEFLLPSGRLLGGWQIQSSFGGVAQTIRVEEYKRPTYEVSFQDPDTPLRLNRQAKLKGEARYYFGLPVTNGKVQWKVTRQPVYSWWWSYYFAPGPQSAPQTIASGTTKLDDKGGFDVSFLPSAEEKKGKEAQGITYQYVASVDLTDEGGETRSATRSFRLGYVSIDASLSLADGFVESGKGFEVTAHRASLDGMGRAGTGKWRLVALKQPEKTVPPADLPPLQGVAPRPRHQHQYDVSLELRRWEDGGEITRGELKHGADGDAKLPLQSLEAGAYRLRYDTPDEFGAIAEASLDFVVAGKDLNLALPAILLVQDSTVPVGGKARFFWHSGLPGQTVFFDLVKDAKVIDRRILKAGSGNLIEIPITEEDRGGFAVALTLITDHQMIRLTQGVAVPYDNKQLGLEFETFRDAFKPGSKQSWRVKIKGKDVGKASAEVLAYMYDRSLDFFAAHHVPSGSQILPQHGSVSWIQSNLGQAQAQGIEGPNDYIHRTPPEYVGDELKFLDDYGIGGMGNRMFLGRTQKYKSARLEHPAPAAPAARAKDGDDIESEVAADASAPEPEGKKAEAPKESRTAAKSDEARGQEGDPSAGGQIRTNFAETAFFKPQLLTAEDGTVAIEFEAPDSVTAWNFWVVAMTKDLRTVEIRKNVQTVKNLMVRPYVPRFFREGDQAQLKVVVNNASDERLSGELAIELKDPETGKDLAASFGLKETRKAFNAPAKGGSNVSFDLKAPYQVGLVAFKVVAKAKDESDGEVRPVPVLPSRLHLTQSRFVSLKDKDEREMTFPELAKGTDKSLVTEQMVVSVDAQLFYGVLKALPYLVRYPYECSEQTMNRFVSTGIVSSVYSSYPAVAAMAKAMSERKTAFEAFDGIDANRRMAFEESPWLQESKGKSGAGDEDLLDVLDPRIAKAERDSALAKLKKSQLPNGAFPWFPGGPASPYITLYLMHGFAKATEFGIPVPKDVVVRGWNYLAQHFREEYARRLIKGEVGWEFLTFLNYVASSYPDPSWMGDALAKKEREDVLAYSFKHWKQHSPYLKGYLALTLKRMGREKDAKLVFDSVMDSAKTEKDLGTFWAQEDRSWLWYNDTIESHAFALRTLMELDPSNAKKDGLVLWLFLNKKLSHWKSTRATAEVIYSLVHYLKKADALGVKETVEVAVGPKTAAFTFEPEKYTGKAQLVVPGPEVDPRTMATVKVRKESKGMAFASASWSFATDELPKEASGDFFQVSRKYFKRTGQGQEVTLKPLDDGDAVEVGDEVEVQLSLRTKHAAEYVHLRDPRGAGFEPVSQVSSYKWDLGIYWYEEVRDSGANFFFEQLPVGEYTFKYRVRANMAGRFRIGPATVQSLYAPEFSAYSAGNIREVKGE